MLRKRSQGATRARSGAALRWESQAFRRRKAIIAAGVSLTIRIREANDVGGCARECGQQRQIPLRKVNRRREVAGRGACSQCLCLTISRTTAILHTCLLNTVRRLISQELSECRQRMKRPGRPNARVRETIAMSSDGSLGIEMQAQGAAFAHRPRWELQGAI
jgi:hypothetical protein